MKAFKSSLLLSLLVAPNSLWAKPLSHSLESWFVTPQPLAPWQYKASANEHQLLALSAKMGGGELFYRPKNQACVISVPHKFYDTHTLKIGRTLYKDNCQVMVTNSHHRFSESEDNEPMDYSKRFHSLHNAAIMAFQKRHAKSKIFQIHGFSAKKRRTNTAKQADFIVSQGRTGDFTKRQLSHCLKKLSPASFYYPEQVRELGGTKNVLHSIGLTSFSFIHIEISKTMRERLISEPKLMSQFSVCLNQVI